MARRAIRTDRLIAVLGVAVVVLGAVVMWFVVRGSGAGLTEEPVSRRVLRQAREQLGRAAEVQLIEPGRGRVVCGYISATKGGRPVRYISRPNRMITDRDPLTREFDDQTRLECPGFPVNVPGKFS